MTLSGEHRGPPTLQGRTILVMEDEYFLAMEVSRALSGAGARVAGPFGELDAGVAAVRAGLAFDCALLDINIRGALVYPLADILRERGIPVVFMTGYDRNAVPAAYRDMPICGKPVDVSVFARLLTQAT